MTDTRGSLRQDPNDLTQLYIQAKTIASRYQSAFENSRDARLLFSFGRHILDANSALIQLSGYSKKELLSMQIDRLCPHLMNPQDIEQSDSLFNKKIQHLVETFLVTRNNEKIPVEMVVTLLSEGAGEKKVGLCDIRDISNTKKTEEEIKKAEKLRSIGALAGGIAHHFNNIMTGLFGNIALARTELPLDHKSGRYLDTAEACMEEGIKLTKQLLTFASGGHPVKETIDISALVEESARFSLSGSNIKLNFSSQENLWPVRADRSQIRQVISNIAMNARQAMTNGGEFTICMEASDLLKDNLLTISKGRYIKMTLSDNGSGIHQKDLERIFDPYFTTRENGSGMGLSICYSIVNRHAGYISVWSQVGVGTTLTIYLPAVLSQKTEDSPVQNNLSYGPSENRATILIMDDEEPIRHLLKKMLEKFGYQVVSTRDGNNAFLQYKHLLENHMPPCLVIMDLTIPGGMGGKEASKLILDLDPKAAIVVSSGYSNDPVMSAPAAYGLKGVIPKPFRLEELKTAVKQFAGKHTA